MTARSGLGSTESVSERRARRCTQSECGEVPCDAVRDVSGRSVGVDMYQQTATRVPLQDGSRLVVVRQHAGGDDVRVSVVGPTSARQSLEHRRERHDEEHHQSDCARSKSFEHLRLSDGARKTVEQNCRSCPMSSESLGDDLGNVAVRNEAAGFERSTYPRAERCAGLDLLTQAVTDRDVRHAVLRHESAALGAFAGSGRSGEHHKRRRRVDGRFGDNRQRPCRVGQRAAHRPARVRPRFETNPTDIADLVGSRKGECPSRNRGLGTRREPSAAPEGKLSQSIPVRATARSDVRTWRRPRPRRGRRIFG